MNISNHSAHSQRLMLIVSVMSLIWGLAFCFKKDEMAKNSPNRKITEVRRAFGIKVRLIRFQLGITQEQLAEKANLHPTYVGSVERGERNIGLENIIAIAKALKCSPKNLMPD